VSKEENEACRKAYRECNIYSEGARPWRSRSSATGAAARVQHARVRSGGSINTR